ncbi:MAG: hypothetical protein ACOH1X_00460 [Kaistella sp.]
MASFPEILLESKNKTRVLLFTAEPSVAKLILQVLNFAGKEFDYFLSSGNFKNEQKDFILVETSNGLEASELHPNIAFLSTEISAENLLLVAKNLTPGGILIYPVSDEKVLDESANFFRKLPYSTSTCYSKDGIFYLNSDMGEIPLPVVNEDIVKDLEGLKTLCQQMGVLEEEFYEALLEFA